MPAKAVPKKNALFLPLLLFLCVGAPAQNCACILHNIEAAYQRGSLGEALRQVRALHACDASAAGRRKADAWTEQIFTRINAQKEAAEQTRAKDACAALALQTQAHSGDCPGTFWRVQGKQFVPQGLSGVPQDKTFVPQATKSKISGFFSLAQTCK